MMKIYNLKERHLVSNSCIKPKYVFLLLLDMMSGELSDKLQLNQANKSGPKTGQLNTPDVSMDQSRNNLDQ